MASSKLPIPSNIYEITAGIVKNDMATFETMYPIRQYSQPYLEGKKVLTDFVTNSRKRPAPPDFLCSPSSQQQRPGPSFQYDDIFGPGPSHIISSYQITIIPFENMGNSTPPSHILPDWKSIVNRDIEVMKTVKKPGGLSDAYLYNVTPNTRQEVMAQKIDVPLKSVKESIKRIMGPEGEPIADTVDSDEGLKESLRCSISKRIKLEASVNPECSEIMKENINSVFK